MSRRPVAPGARSPSARRRRPPKPSGGRRTSARKVALDALERIDAEGAYANLVLRRLLDDSGLDERDRGFVTELVYGTTRMRRACDFLVDQFLSHPPPVRVRNALRLGAYQLAFAGVPAHAAVGETVEVTPQSARGLANAVLRKVAASASKGAAWPDDATRLSVPDWVLERLAADLGRDRALAALEAMNEPGTVTTRADGYVQDVASQLVVDAVEVQPGDRVLDVAAAPGGKTTGMAQADASTWVVAADVQSRRLSLVHRNADQLGLADQVTLLAADGTRPPWRPASFDRVLVDAPCSGMGTLRRRADLRWRVGPTTVERLAALQKALVDANAPLVRPGGLLVYSVCTLTTAESLGIDDHVAEHHPDLVPLDPPGEPWEPWGRGAILLPQTVGSDGMCLLRYRRVT